jgi:Protein of unknown function (DUF5672)
MPTTLQLRDVTLLAVTSINTDQTNAALRLSAKDIEFGAVKLLTSELPATPDPAVEYVRIPPIDFLGYSRFMIESLNKYVQTSHCLVIQADGFVLTPSRWEHQFLDYDYIGAPWPDYIDTSDPNVGQLRLDRNFVGNGGFSLRSKRLLEVTSRLRFDCFDFPCKSEDILICHYLYEAMRTAGIRFAPPQLAALFSIESFGIYDQSLHTVFGFHGTHWLERVAALMNSRERPLPPRLFPG